MKKELNQIERIIIAIIYIIVMLLLFKFMGKDVRRILDFSENSSIWFYSGALLIVLGNYITEPFFSKPTDTIANTISLILAILAINNKEQLVGYYLILIFAIVMLVLSIILILIKDKQSKIKNVLFFIVQKLGNAKVLFSTIYLLSAYSYFANNELMKFFIIAIALWICLVFFDIISIFYLNIRKIFKLSFNASCDDNIGHAIISKDEDFFEIELNSNNVKKNLGEIVGIYRGKNIFWLAIVIEEKLIIDKKIAEIKLLKDDNGIIKATSEELGYLKNNKNIFTIENDIKRIQLDNISKKIKIRIENNIAYKEKDNLIGYIISDSNINIIKFKIVSEKKHKMREGMIVKTLIQGEETLYQVIDGVTKIQEMDHNDISGKMAIARKLGKYDYDISELKSINWVPNSFETVYSCNYPQINEKNIAEKCIGRLPNTDMGIPILDINTLVTHNTAILGILGIGKSCLAYELIKKVAENEVKVICIDITNQYSSEKGLYYYCRFVKHMSHFLTNIYI